MDRVIVAIPHSHTWFWTQTCIASLEHNPPKAQGCEVKIVMIDNSPWSPAIKGIRCTPLGVSLPLFIKPNHKSNKFHASALDSIVEMYDFDYLMALETDVMALRPTWLQWFLDQLRPDDFAVGMWHHEQFVNPSCTLYRGDVLRQMRDWCMREAPQKELRWGPEFKESTMLDCNLPARLAGMDTDQAIAELDRVTHDIRSWVCGPFAEKRGWPEGTVLKEPPSGQLKGPGWYEPGQQLHHWAVDRGFTYTVCPSFTTTVDNVPVQTMYGATVPDPGRQMEAEEMFGNAEAVHLWGGTRALDILKHPVTCEFVSKNTPKWLAREARFWRDVVPVRVQIATLKLIREFGWHTTGQGSDHVSDRDYAAARYVEACYKEGGVECR